MAQETKPLETVPFVVSVNEGDQGTKGLFTRADSTPRLVEIPLHQLKQNLSAVSSAMIDALEGIREVGRFRLKEVTLQVEISAQGGVHCIGTASLGAKGAISLKFEEA